MLWKLLGTTQGYEMPVTEFFPGIIWFCLERQALPSMEKGSFLPSYDIQRDCHMTAGSLVLAFILFSTGISGESLEKATIGI